MLDKLKNTFDKGVVKVSVKSETFLETNKVKSQIQNCEKEMNNIKNLMAANIYTMWKTDGIVVEEIESFCRSIKQKEDEIAALEAKIESIKNEEKQILGGGATAIGCNHCGTVNPPDAKFCASCGKKLI